LNSINVHQVPKLEKIVVSVGTGKHKDDKRNLEAVKNTLTRVTGQAPVERLGKEVNCNFKIRAGMGAPRYHCVTLRGAQMYEFLDRFVNVALPRVRDFHGVGVKFDKGWQLQSRYHRPVDFPRTNVRGNSACFTVCRSPSLSLNEDKAHSRALLEKFGIPFEKEGGVSNG
jgi:large subunit ribosomal protein L5